MSEPTGETPIMKLIEELRNLQLYILDMKDYGDKEMHHIVDTLTKLISTPLRNCDVGTAEEQIKRWEEFCIAHHAEWQLTPFIKNGCDCPCHQGNGCNYFVWAQMPYEEGGAK